MLFSSLTLLPFGSRNGLKKYYKKYFNTYFSVLSFGHINCRNVYLLSDSTELDGTLLVALKAPK